MNQMIIDKLRHGETVRHREKGNSMTPLIKSGQPVLIAPVKLKNVRKGDIVFCRVAGMLCCHKVTAVDKVKERFQIGNNHGHINGWTKAVYGKVIKILDYP